jgi:hypothetical protein
MMQGFMDQHQVPITGAIDDVSARFDSVVELSDRLLDRVDQDLDRQEVVQMAPSTLQLAAGTRVSSVALLLDSARRAAPAAGTAPAPAMVANKPQQRWRDEVDNSSRPFVPKLRSKPNAILPLELRLEQPDESGRDLSPLSALGTAASSARPQPAACLCDLGLDITGLPVQMEHQQHSCNPCSMSVFNVVNRKLMASAA